MNDHGQELTRQRFVDGELGVAEQQAYLEAVAKEPDGWQRLALAFVEVQVWDKACRASARGPAEIVLPDAARHRGRSLGWVAALAVSVAAAVCLGFALGTAVESGRSGGPPLAGHHESRAEPGELANINDGNAPTAPAQPSDVEGFSKPIRPVMRVRLVDSSSGDGEAVEVPVFAASQLPSGVLHCDDALPPDLYQALRESGYRVEPHRRVRSIELNDGRRIVLPVDEFHVQYVSTGIQ